MKKEELEAKMAKIAELRDKAEEAKRARERAEEAEDSAYRNLDAELFALVESLVGKTGNMLDPDWDEHQRYITKKALEIAHDAELCNNSDLKVAEGELLARHARRWELYKGVDAKDIINSYIESKDKADVLGIAQYLSKGGQAFANSMVQELTGDNSIWADAVYIAQNSYKVREQIKDSEWDDEYEPSEFIRLTRGGQN